MSTSYFHYKVFYKNGLTYVKTYNYQASCLKAAYLLSLQADVDYVDVYDNYEYICFFKKGKGGLN